MSATRAIVAAQERLRVLTDAEQPRVQGALSEVTTAAREVPLCVVAGIRRLADTGNLQRLWDANVAHAEGTCDDPVEGLKTALLATLEDVACTVVSRVLGDREIELRHASEALAAERRTLEWVTAESKREPSTPPPASE